VFGGSQTNTRHHNNVNNMEQALKEVWPEGSYDVRKIDGGTTMSPPNRNVRMFRPIEMSSTP
jgi:hypothetical protein